MEVAAKNIFRAGDVLVNFGTIVIVEGFATRQGLTDCMLVKIAKAYNYVEGRGAIKQLRAQAAHGQKYYASIDKCRYAEPHEFELAYFENW
jgi:hypothetical protein